MSKPPAFQFYASDFVASTIDMSAEEVGVYIRLLCYQWDNGGLPNDTEKLERIAGCSGNAVAQARHKFGICQDGKLRNDRLEQVRGSAEAYRQKQSEKAKNRWKSAGKHSSAQARHKLGISSALPKHMHMDMPEACSPSPSPILLEKESKGADAPDVFDGLIEELQSDAFKAAWKRYTAYRAERKLQKLKRVSVLAQWEKFAEWGQESAIAAINETIRQGWTGIFEPKAKPVAASATDEDPEAPYGRGLGGIPIRLV